MRKTLSSVATVVGLLAASTSSVAAVDFGIFVSQGASDDFGAAFGLGGRIWVDIDDNLDLEVSAQWLEEFERNQGVLEPTPFPDFAFSATTKVEAIPVDLGLAYSFGDEGRGLFIGGGGTWASLEGEMVITDPSLPGGIIDLGGVDDEFGWYAKLGYQSDVLFVDFLYRHLSAAVEGLGAVPLAGIPSRIDIDLSGFQANLGWRF